MDTTITKTSLGLNFAQIAWVVKDIEVAKIVFFDTYKEIGVMTEIMGITEEGEEQVQKMKN
jgi:hypothetical protein